MARVGFAALVFVLILAFGVVWTARPGEDADFEAARARILAAMAADQRLLRLRDLPDLGALPAEIGTLDQLVQLDLSGTVISDISPLRDLTSLRILNLRGTLVQDLTPLRALQNMDMLDLNGSWVQDLTPLAALPKLRRLDIGRTWVASLAPLTEAPALDWVNLYGGMASDGSAEFLAVLRARGVTLNNAGDFARDRRPGLFERLKIRLTRTLRWVQS